MLLLFSNVAVGWSELSTDESKHNLLTLFGQLSMSRYSQRIFWFARVERPFSLPGGGLIALFSYIVPASQTTHRRPNQMKSWSKLQNKNILQLIFVCGLWFMNTPILSLFLAIPVFWDRGICNSWFIKCCLLVFLFLCVLTLGSELQKGLML